MSRHSQPRNRGRRLITQIIIVVVLAGFVIGGTVAFNELRKTLEPGDYPAGGSGDQVVFVIREGETATDIGEHLVNQSVIKSYKGFIDAFNTYSPQPTFQPGAYPLHKQMAASEAIDVLQDPTQKIDVKVTIPEGYRQSQILALLSQKIDMPLEQLQQAAKDVGSFNVPAQAKSVGSLEGFLFPATYTFDPELTAHQVLAKLVDRANLALDQHGVVGDDQRYRVMTEAAVVQKESGNTTDMGKVAQVVNNRIAQGMPLQMDSTVTYGSGRTDAAEPTKQERDDTSNKYNTYANPGLPIGPIGNPGDDAIQAVLQPTPGAWLYFVTVNLDTGETVFSETYDQHQQAVARYNAWKAQKGIQ